MASAQPDLARLDQRTRRRSLRHCLGRDFASNDYQRHEAVILIDEAHAIGVFGPNGRGLAAALDGREDTVVLRTFGKALGCESALICGLAVVRDYLVNWARPLDFSTAT